MADNFVTETPFQLFNAAAGDISTIINSLEGRLLPVEFCYGNICFIATQVAEKYLKGFIISNNQNVEKTHKIDYLHELAVNRLVQQLG